MVIQKIIKNLHEVEQWRLHDYCYWYGRYVESLLNDKAYAEVIRPALNQYCEMSNTDETDIKTKFIKKGKLM